MELAYLIYKSVPMTNISETNLLEITEQSKANNAENEITGILLYGNNQFIQVLEGAEKDIDALYQKLLTDKRQSDLIIINKGWLISRYFPTWSMGFRSINDHEIKLINKVLEGEIVVPVNGYVALEMITGFIKRNLA